MKQEHFDKLVTSIRQAGRIRRGQAKPGRIIDLTPVDVKAIRQRLKKSQAEFTRMIGVSVATLQNWEQGRRQECDQDGRPKGSRRHGWSSLW
jgi:putative transcriptional regulator